MNTLNLVLLGLIALASLLQAAALVWTAREGRRTLRRLDDFAARVGRGLQPALGDLERASENFAEVTEVGAAQAQRVDRVVARAVERIERAVDLLQEVVLPSASRLMAAAAAFRGVRKGLQLLRRWRG